MGTRGLIALGLVAASAGAARADHYDDLGIRVDPPGVGMLKEDGKTIAGTAVADTDNIGTTINVTVVDVDWSQKSLAQLIMAAQTLPGSAGHELKSGTRVVRGHVVVTELWEANVEDMRFESVFFPTAKGLYIASFSTAKADFDKTAYDRNKFFRAGIAFDDGAPGLELPSSALRERLKGAAGGLDAFTAIADSKVKITITDTKQTKQLVKAKLDQAAWDGDLAPLFAELAEYGDATCDDAKLVCTLMDPIGPAVEYRFKKARGGAKLVEIRATSE